MGQVNKRFDVGAFDVAVGAALTRIAEHVATTEPTEPAIEGRRAWRVRDARVPFVSLPEQVKRAVNKDNAPSVVDGLAAQGAQVERSAPAVREAGGDEYDPALGWEIAMVEGVASSTSVDWYGTEMTEPCLQDMKAACGNGVPIVRYHGSFFEGPADWDEVIGCTRQAFVERATVAKPGDPAEQGFTMSVKFAIYNVEPGVELMRRLDGGQVIGLSIGGWFVDVTIIEEREGDEVTYRVLVNKVDLDHIAVTRIPANPDAMGLALVRSRLGAAVRTRGAAIVRDALASAKPVELDVVGEVPAPAPDATPEPAADATPELDVTGIPEPTTDAIPTTSEAPASVSAADPVVDGTPSPSQDAGEPVDAPRSAPSVSPHAAGNEHEERSMDKLDQILAAIQGIDARVSGLETEVRAKPSPAMDKGTTPQPAPVTNTNDAMEARVRAAEAAAEQAKAEALAAKAQAAAAEAQALRAIRTPQRRGIAYGALAAEELGSAGGKSVLDNMIARAKSGEDGRKAETIALASEAYKEVLTTPLNQGYRHIAAAEQALFALCNAGEADGFIKDPSLANGWS